MSQTILVIDDEPSIRGALKRAFAGQEVLEAESLADGLAQAKDGFPDIVLLDQRLPDGDGMSALPQFKAIDPDLPVVLLTGHGSTDLAVDALKHGAADYVEKPFKLERIRRTVEVHLERLNLGRQVAKLSGTKAGRTQVVARSAGMKRVMALVKRVAAVPSSTVLIQGESGVGKELVARSIHERSSRRDRAFIAINCAALSENLLEAELFGYEKGAFTGADSKGKPGLFQAAEGGTVFLDEVGEMPLALQTKLLRALQERCFRRVGGVEDIHVDVRVVAATNRDLRREVAAGRFRLDLYYRLRVVPLPVPPLRDRPEDILPVADHLLARLAPDLGRPAVALGGEAREAMVGYAWPGNVRELANAIERAVITAATDTIQPDDLVLDEELLPDPQAVEGDDAAPVLPEGALVIAPGQRNLAEIEAMIIDAVMAETGGQKSKAAELLGINRTTLYNKLRDDEA